MCATAAWQSTPFLLVSIHWETQKVVPAKPCDLAVGRDEMVRILVTDLAVEKVPMPKSMSSV